MYQHRYSVSIDFEGEMLGIPDDVSVTEVKFLIDNLIRGLLFQVQADGTSVVPFDSETLTVEVTPMIAKGA